MTIAPNTPSTAAAPAAAEAAVADVTTLLPAREAVLDRLAEQLPTVGTAPATMLIIGLLRRDDGWPTSPDTLAQVTTLLARSVRGDDWLASSGPAEFVVVLGGPVTAAETAAVRLVAAIADLGIPGLSAAAGVSPLVADLAAGEVLRRATLSLSAARRVGAGTVIRYREPS
jgi:GGDEF domain-containing protein